jgi:hypothetical protein
VVKPSSWSSPRTRSSRWRWLFEAYPFGRSASRASEPVWAGFGPGVITTIVIVTVVLLLVAL